MSPAWFVATTTMKGHVLHHKHHSYSSHDGKGLYHATSILLLLCLMLWYAGGFFAWYSWSNLFMADPVAKSEEDALPNWDK